MARAMVVLALPRGLGMIARRYAPPVGLVPRHPIGVGLWSDRISAASRALMQRPGEPHGL